MRRIGFARGFTLIEVLITLVIMVILLALGVAAMSSIEAHARDSEREQDIETIARGLELRYKLGSTYTELNGSPPTEGATVTNKPGAYPGNNEMWQLLWYRTIPVSDDLPGVSDSALKTPTGGDFNALCFFYPYNGGCDSSESGCNPSTTADCWKAEKPIALQAAFTDGNGGWKDRYIYEFIGRDGRYCSGDACVRFNLYWISETDKTVYKGIPGLKVYKSKHK